jgi:hypothetical protein
MGVNLCLYAVFRLALWCAGVFLALFPTLLSIHDPLSVFMLEHINEAGKFRDLFFLLAPACVVSLTTTLDFIFGDHGTAMTRAAAILVLIANFAVFVAAFIGFFTVLEDLPLDEGTFYIYRRVILGGLLVSVLSEVWVSTAIERRLQLLIRNWNDINRVRERVRVLLGHTQEER